MKVYVVNAFEEDFETGWFDSFIGTQKLFVDKYHAQQWVSKREFEDEVQTRYTVEELEL